MLLSHYLIKRTFKNGKTRVYRFAYNELEQAARKAYHIAYETHQSVTIEKWAYTSNIDKPELIGTIIAKES